MDIRVCPQMMSDYVLPMVTLTEKASLDFPDRYSLLDWAYDPILSMTTYMERVMMTSSKTSAVFHMRLKREGIDYLVPLSLVLKAGVAWIDARNVSVRSDTKAIIGVVTPTAGV